MADTCRCHLPFGPPDGPHWWPLHDPEPDQRVSAVALAGDNPRLMYLVRRPEGWSQQGVRVYHPDVIRPMPWTDVGRCWDGVHHAVVDATEAVAGSRPAPDQTTTHRDGGS